MESHVKWFLGILTVFVLFVGGLGGLTWWWAAPMGYAGEVDAAPKRLGIFAQPDDYGQPSRLDILNLLNEEKYDDLTRLVEAKTALAVADVRNETESGRVVNAFAIEDPAVAALFDRWVAAHPNSFAPYLARAAQSFALASLARGTAVARDTTPEQFDGMQRHLARAIDDAHAAIALNPNATEAYRLLIDAARAGGTQRDCGVFAQRGLAVEPASSRIRFALAMCRLPRWGGSHDTVQRIAVNAAPFFADNPELSALHGVVPWDQGRMAEGDAAIALFDKALASGPYWRFHFDRAREHFNAGRFDMAAADAAEALRLNPQEPDPLLLYVRSASRLGRTQDVDAGLAVLQVIDGQNPELQKFVESRQQRAANTWGQGQQSPADSYYWSGREKLKAGQNDAALADFLEAVRINPDHFESYRNIDYIHAMRNEWPAIIEHWNNYLGRNPNDARALFERSGTYFHMGNRPASIADLMQACNLGLNDACEQKQRLGVQ